MIDIFHVNVIKSWFLIFTVKAYIQITENMLSTLASVMVRFSQSYEQTFF